MPDRSPTRHPGWLLATDLSARCNRPLERARQLAAAFPFPLTALSVFDTRTACGEIHPMARQARAIVLRNCNGTRAFQLEHGVVDNSVDLATKACTNNWRVNCAWQGAACGALLSRLAGALENSMKKPETELRLCARRYMSHCPEG